MKGLALRSALLGGLGLLGCADTRPAAQDAAIPAGICDGADGLALQYVSEIRGSGQTLMLSRNGGYYLRVDGHCNYWTLRSGDALPIRQGVLTREQELQLQSELRVDQWDEWHAREGQTLIHDTGRMVFVSRDSWFSCLGGCESEMPDPWYAEVRPIFARAEHWLETLNAAGTPVDGPVRVLAKVSALEKQYWLPEALVPWQASVALSELIFPTATEGDRSPFPIGGVLISGADADWLRAVRAAARLRGENTGALGALIGVEDGDRILELLIADVLPQEDERGVVPDPRVVEQ